MKHLIILFLSFSLFASAYACGCGCTAKKNDAPKPSSSCCPSEVEEKAASSCSTDESSCGDSAGRSSCSE